MGAPYIYDISCLRVKLLEADMMPTLSISSNTMKIRLEKTATQCVPSCGTNSDNKMVSTINKCPEM